ncbi:DUF4270 domain-containing protein [uncultured Algibacter sp.]|uniref:DUF4270 domain-containing protein n=1 Tax=uncultured Algibacter sp. TaxID=298659 RepID=UPI0026259B4F|nr:DUF4270 domain-containing protein [uncultured Algibacter sp.]
MKNIFKALKFPFVSLLILLSFIACDKDFNVIESEVLGEENANFFTDSMILPIVAHNKKVEAVQINNLASNLLGVFNDPAYGRTTASIISQLTPTTFGPSIFGTNPVLDSVAYSIPYFSRLTEVDVTTETSKYAIDSVYGNPSKPFKLTIYQNNYYLRDFDPNGDVNNTQNYFSKSTDITNPNHNFALDGTQTIDFDNHLGEKLIETTLTPGSEQVTLLPPGFRLLVKDDLESIAFWKSTILDKREDAVLANANSFRNYFRGLYLKAEAIGDDGNMILLDLESANITLYFTKGASDARIQGEYVLNFSGNILNSFINDYNITLEDGDQNLGDQKLYLKGTEGSMAVVNLFPTPEDLQNFKDQFLDADGNQVRLINEALLIIREDESVETNGNPDFHNSDRIFAYDIKNNTTTIDYDIDPIESNEALNSKTLSLGNRDTSGRYKIRLTEHLNSILQQDSTNFKIGLVLSTNVNYTSISETLNSGNSDINGVPAAAVISPRGTVLYGSNDNVPESNRLQLKIFFTETRK